MFDGLTQAQAQITEFISERIRKDLEAQTKLLGCRSLEDVRAVQTDFFKQAMQEYSGVAARIMKLTDAFTPKALQKET
jgi:hypothetical protein